MPEPRAPSFRRLVAWQINSTSDALRRGAALWLRREHDISLVECRTLELIEYMQPVRLRDVAAESAADKAQVSRIVSALVRRGLVVRQAFAGDARSARLELSESGVDMCRRLAASGEERDRALRASIGEAEAAQMLRALAAVKASALRLVDEEEPLQRPRLS
ncbi:MAG TPA: MarR family winged helix-turn-helix transcriptional regulator [Ramlibacter sp.]|nr:MarR family winged helix-turn-helix transcriptional regulator [Ramlibacter sp.]